MQLNHWRFRLSCTATTAWMWISMMAGWLRAMLYLWLMYGSLGSFDWRSGMRNVCRMHWAMLQFAWRIRLGKEERDASA